MYLFIYFMCLMFIYSCTHVAIEDQKYDGPAERSQFRLIFNSLVLIFQGHPTRI